MTDDLDRIMGVMQAAFDPAYGEAWTRRQVGDALVLPHTFYLLAGVDGQAPGPDEPVTGFVLSRGAAGDEELLLIAVHPEHRGKGVGKALIEALLDHPELRSVSAWMLNTSDAHGLYARFGFRPTTDGNEMRLDRPVAAASGS